MIDRSEMAVIATLLLSAVCGVTAAQEAELSSNLRACASLRNEFERLGCYDRVVETLTQDEPAELPAQTAEQMFGFSRAVSDDKRVQNAPERKQLAQITARVAAVREVAGKAILVELDNGQAWEQQDEDVTLLLRNGDTVTISRAALGTFRIATPSKRYARVKRVR
jgi:hypothetical protein